MQSGTESRNEPQLEQVPEAAPERSSENLSDVAPSAVSLRAAEAAPLESDAWQVISVLPRLDADTHADLMTEVHTVLATGSRYIALDLTQNRFFSLNAIQLCVSLARDLASDEGCLALVGCGERTKRHFEIYGSLKDIKVVRTITELVQERTGAVVMRPRSASSQAAG